MNRTLWCRIGCSLALAAAVLLIAGCSTEAPPADPAPSAQPADGEISLSTSSEGAREAYLRGRDLLENFHFEEARTAFQEAVAADPELALAHLQLAVTAPSTREFLSQLELAHSLSDGASEAEREWILGLRASVHEDPEGQLEHYRKVVELHPSDPRARQLLGAAYFAQQRHREAAEELQAAIDLDPAFAVAYNDLGYCFRSLGEYEAAERTFRRYVELRPDDPNPYDSYAELLLKMGRYEESIAQYRKALEKDSGFAASSYGIASNLVYLGRHAEARAELARVLDGDPDDGQRRHALYVAAATWVDEGRLDEALAELESARALAAAISDAADLAADQEAIGVLLLEAGRVEAARLAFAAAKDAIDRASLEDELVANARRSELFHRTRLSIAEGDLARARDLAERYRSEVEPLGNRYLSWNAHLLDGLVAQAEERWDDAHAAFERANPEDSYALYRKAQVLEAAGETERARRLYLATAGFNPLLDLNHAYVRRAALGAAGTVP